jgi:DNA-binding transcriptional ArsR family regulator
MHVQSSPSQPDPLSTTFAALADPTRRAILARLATGSATVTELAAPFDLSLPAISKHLKVLQRANLVEQGRQAQWRPCRLNPEPLRDVADWLGPYTRLRRESLDRLDQYLRELQNKEPGDDA